MNKTTTAIIATILTASWATTLAYSDEQPPEPTLAVYPDAIQLTTSRDRQSIVVQLTRPDGITQDITAVAKLAMTDPNVAAINGAVLSPKQNGETQLSVSHRDQTLSIPLTVSQVETKPPVSFKNDVMPVFMKGGCNQGSCHGAARGKDGFRLSLFGFDPDGDYHRLTHEMSGRRINLALPEESLLIQKSTGQVPHTGGSHVKAGDELYNTMIEWLRAGAENDPGEVPAVESIELYPPSAVLNGAGTQQQLTVRANYSDGTDRDVTTLAYFSSNNDNAAEVSQTGLVTAKKRGEAFVMARFDTHTFGRHFIVLPRDQQFQWNDAQAYNYIDDLMYEKFRKLRINPSEVCDDETFLRRATLDICGTLPTTEEYHDFVTSDDPDKRNNLVDDLLERKEFVELWVMKWSELLQIKSSRRVSYKAMLLYYSWLQERIANNVRIDQLVQQLLGANGGTFANAATNYFQNETDTLKVAENIAQVFMGMRIQCAQCHNHPFDRWTMDDYYSFAAFFAQIGRKRGEDPRETIVFNKGSGDVKHLVGGRVMAPKFLGGDAPDTKSKDRREILAKWLASPENPYFATNLSNIVWAHFFGKGLIDPVDDVRISNPAVNRQLLDTLGSQFTQYEYDFKKLVRDICTSRTYQLSTQTNETNATDDQNFSHASLRRLRSEVLLDIISQVTETKNKFRGLPLGARAVQIADGNTSTYFLTAFGRAKRDTVCSCEVKMEPNLSQALHLLNGNTLNGKIRTGNVVKRMLDEGKTPTEIIEELFIRCFTRRPNEKETAGLLTLIEGEKDQKAMLEDVFWSVLNSREFVFNH